MDILSGEADTEHVRFPTMRPVAPELTPAQSNIDEALAILRSAERPVMLAGTSVKWSNAASQIQSFIEKTKVPTFVNGMGRGMVKPGTPELLNRVRKEAMQ